MSKANPTKKELAIEFKSQLDDIYHQVKEVRNTNEIERLYYKYKVIIQKICSGKLNGKISEISGCVSEFGDIELDISRSRTEKSASKRDSYLEEAKRHIGDDVEALKRSIEHFLEAK